MALFAPQHGICFFVADELLCFGVPFELATELHGDVSHVRDRDRTVSDFGGRVCFFAVFNGVGEVEMFAAGNSRAGAFCDSLGAVVPAKPSAEDGISVGAAAAASMPLRKRRRLMLFALGTMILTRRLAVGGTKKQNNYCLIVTGLYGEVLYLMRDV